MSEIVEWLGLSAVYTSGELAVMADLKAGVGAGTVAIREVEVMHELKGLLGARIVEPESLDSPSRGIYPVASSVESALPVRNDKSPPQRWSRHEGLVGQGSLLI